MTAPGDRPPAQDALVTFLGTATLVLLALLVAHRVRPEWFGLEAATGGGGGAFTARGAGDRPPPVPRAPAPPSMAQRVFADSVASVVHVTSRSSFDLRQVQDEFVSGTGSGMVWDHEGHIVTCAHVFQDATSAFVTFSDGTEYEAKLVERDPALDLAVVRVDAPAASLVPVRLGTSADLAVGSTVFSIACPYGLGPSISQGIVSGLGRRIRSVDDVEISGTIQVDVPIHRGSSGGALLDDQARVVGMNAAIHAGSQRQVGVGFVQPIDRLVEAVPGIIERGYRWEPAFGFMTFGDPDTAMLLQVVEGASGVPEAGVVVAEVDPGGPAEAAGLRPMLEEQVAPAGQRRYIVRDIIVAAAGRPVARREDLRRILADHPAGAPLELTVARRAGRETLVLQPRP